MTAALLIGLGMMIGAPLGILAIAIVQAGSREDERMAAMVEQWDGEEKLADPYDDVALGI